MEERAQLMRSWLCIDGYVSHSNNPVACIYISSAAGDARGAAVGANRPFFAKGARHNPADESDAQALTRRAPRSKVTLVNDAHSDGRVAGALRAAPQKQW